MARPQKTIKIEQCISLFSEEFSKFKDPRNGFSEIELKDFLLSTYAIFALKYPSLLNFQNEMEDEKKFHNLKSLFKVDRIPSNTHLRDIIDELDYSQFRIIFKKLFADLQRSKLFERYEFIRMHGRPHYLINSDGSGYFRSEKIKCDCCMEYNTTKENKPIIKFGHNMLGSALVHPDHKEVFPFCPEPIINKDGNNKNDCEQNSFKRFISDFRREHPKLDVVINLDALFATEPPIRYLMEHDCSFIIGVKETNGTVYMQVKDGEIDDSTKSHEYSYEIGGTIKKQVHHRYRYRTNVRLTQNMNSPKLNFVEFWEVITWVDSKGKEQQKKCHFAWVTDIPLTKESIVTIMKGGRARWKIENETFNTLKNHGYNLEHNYGHGRKNLSVNFIMMMFLAFFVDQIQLSSCQVFKKVLKKKVRLKYLWQEIVAQFKFLFYKSWEEFYGMITGDFILESKLIRSG